MGKISDTAIIHPNVVIGKNVNIDDDVEIYEGCILKDNVSIGKGSIIRERCVLSENVTLGKMCSIDYNVIIRENVFIGNEAFVGADCILGELLAGQLSNMKQNSRLIIGDFSIIRSKSIIYGGCKIGRNFQTGHRVTIRENSIIGNNVRIGTLSDIQGECEIKDYVNIHSNVHIGQKSLIQKYVWIFPYVILTNDPTPPSDKLIGVNIEEYAVIATNSVILPGIKVGRGALVGAGSVVTKDVNIEEVVIGNPAKPKGKIQDIKDKETGENIYPWQYNFERGMPWQGIGYENWVNRQE